MRHEEPIPEFIGDHGSSREINLGVKTLDRIEEKRIFAAMKERLAPIAAALGITVVAAIGYVGWKGVLDEARGEAPVAAEMFGGVDPACDYIRTAHGDAVRRCVTDVAADAGTQFGGDDDEFARR